MTRSRLGLLALLVAATAPVIALPWYALAQGTPGAEEPVAPVTVTGTLAFPPSLPAGPPATIAVRIEDVSRADAPATVLAAVTLEAVSVPPAPGAPVTFAIPVASIDPRARYSVRVHVDRDGDGRVSPGDLVSTSGHPVLTYGAGTAVTVPLSVVGSPTTPAAATPVPAAAAIPPVVWELTGLLEADGSSVAIADPARYTLQFLPDGRLIARLDCNQGNGGYTAENGSLALAPMAVTAKLCLPGSQDAAFRRLLAQATAYRFDPEGNLLLRGDAGVLRLQAALTGVTWLWQETLTGSGDVVLRPDQPDIYTLTFLPEGQVAIQADCNRATGRYTVTGAQMTLHLGGVTRRMCPPGSLMDPFLASLGQAVSYSVVQGQLALALAEGGGVMTFAPVTNLPPPGTPSPD